MTTNRRPLMQAVQPVGDADLLRQLAATALANLMAFAVEELVGAAKGQQAPAARITPRQGYRERPLHTRLGTLELRLPKVRPGT
jgi:transposase-like protein